MLIPVANLTVRFGENDVVHEPIFVEHEVWQKYQAELIHATIMANIWGANPLPDLPKEFETAAHEALERIKLSRKEST